MRTSATAILALTASFGNAKDKELIPHRTSQQNQHENIKEQLLSFLSGEKSNQHPPKQGNAKNSLRSPIENLSAVGGITEKEDFKEDDASNFSTSTISDKYNKNTPSSFPAGEQRFLKFSSDGVLVNNDKNKVDDLRAQGPHKNLISNHDTIEGDQPEADVGILRVPRRLRRCGDISCDEVAFNTPCGDQGEGVQVALGSCNSDLACTSTKAPALINCNSCNGYRACEYLGNSKCKANSFYIDDRSCNAYKACASSGREGGAIFFDIAHGSCNSEKACYKVGSRAKNYFGVMIGDDCCIGSSACERIGYEASKGIIGIGYYSCIGKKACYMVVGNMDGMTSHGSRAVIYERSCIGDESCSFIGYYLRDGKVLIDGKSCVGYRSCFAFELEGYGFSFIKNGSCYGKRACENVGRESRFSSFKIRDGSCKGDYSCYAMGYRGAGFDYGFIVDGGSCIGENSCNSFGRQASGESSITNGSCHGKKACENVGFSSVGGRFKIRDGSCTGDYSCYAMGYYGPEESAIGAYIQIDSGACNGYGACFQLGKYSKSNKVKVGVGSCKGKFACATAWIKDEGKEILIGIGSCTCDWCCAFLKPGSHIGMGECTSLSDGCSAQPVPVIKLSWPYVN